MELYKRNWSRRELEAHVGRLEQVGGVRRMLLVEGPEAGVEQIQVRTGAGLEYYVSPQRSLDISLAEFMGAPISWQSPNGDVHPAYYDDRGLNWLRTAAGGLLMTCGLTQVGSPCDDGGVQLGLHGRAHHTPARQVASQGSWLDEQTYEITISGIVEETFIFGECVRMSRLIRSWLGENRIAIRDVVENLSFTPVPHMLLYHFNFGFPLLGEATTTEFPSRRVLPREESTPLDGYERWEAPHAGYQERVYYHEDFSTQRKQGPDGPMDWAIVRIYNPHFPMMVGNGLHPASVYIGWDTQTLPYLVQWKMPGQGVHVLGIEPANCHVGGRAKEREQGSLENLAPGERRVYNLEISIEM